MRSVSLLLALHLIVAITAIQSDVDVSSHSLSCCTAVAPPYVTRGEDGEFSGLSFEYLDLLKKRTGLKCRSITQYNGSSAWNDVIDVIGRCTSSACQCELGIGAWSQTVDRLEVAFLPPFVYGGLSVLVHIRDTSASNGAFFLTAFSPLVWLCILVLNTVFAMLKLLDRRFAPAPEVQYKEGGMWTRGRAWAVKGRTPYRVRRAVQSTAARMIGQEGKRVEGDDRSTRQWLLNFVIALCGIVVVLSYEAVMTAGLVQESLRSEIRGVEDLKSCRVDDSEVCFADGNVVELFWTRVVAKAPCRRRGGNGNVRRFGSGDEVLEALKRRECKYVLADSGSALRAANGRYCGELVITGEMFFHGGLSFVLAKGVSVMRKLQRAALRIRAEDGLPTLEGYVKGEGECTRVEGVQLTWEKLKIFFVIAFAVCGLLFLEMVVDPQQRFWTDQRDGARGEEEGAEEGEEEGEEEEERDNSGASLEPSQSA